MKCKLHPKYKAVRKPGHRNIDLLRECRCWEMYWKAHPDEKVPNFLTGKPMSLNDWGKAGRDAAAHLVKVLNESNC